MGCMRYLSVLFLVIMAVCNAYGQSIDIEKVMYRYHKTKTLKWANKQDPASVEILFLDNFDQSTFPTPDILKFSNLKHLIVHGRSLVKANSKEIKDPVKLVIDENALVGLKKLEYLQLSKFDFRTFPKEICALENLKGLGLNNCIIENIPSEISKMKNLQGIFLRQNRLAELPKGLEELSQLKVIDLCNNGFTTFPEQLLRMPFLESIYLANYNGIKTEPFTWDWPVELSINNIDYEMYAGELNELLSRPKLKKLHLHVNNSKIKKAVKATIKNPVASKKIVWQSIDCGCG